MDEFGDDMFGQWDVIRDGAQKNHEPAVSAVSWDIDEISSPIFPIPVQDETTTDLSFDLLLTGSDVAEEPGLVVQPTRYPPRRSAVFRPFTSLEALEESVKQLNAFIRGIDAPDVRNARFLQ